MEGRNIHDPSISSYYVTNEYYEQLLIDYSDWQREELEIGDPGIRDSCRHFLEKESYLLQDMRFNHWLKLYAAECLYWVPGTAAAGDPRREVAIAFDDRRRLEDRVYRLQTSHAWSQRPPSRTVRMVGNVTVFSTCSDNVIMTRSNFLINEFWAEETRLWGGWSGHRLRRIDSGWEILAKQVNLIDCDSNLRNPSILL
jgi:3-phenylpropionate/cinnamic acid dioxygenase small subunit